MGIRCEIKMIRLGPIRFLLLAQASIAQRWQDMKAEGMFEVQRLADQSKAALNYFEANPSACSSCNELAAYLGDADYDKMWSWMVDRTGEQIRKIDQALSANINNITSGDDGIADIYDKYLADEIGVGSCELNKNFFDNHPRPEQKRNGAKPDFEMCRKQPSADDCSLKKKRDDCKCKCSGGEDKQFMKEEFGKIPPEKSSDGKETKDSNQKGSAKPNEQLKDEESTGKYNEKPTKTVDELKPVKLELKPVKLEECKCGPRGHGDGKNMFFKDKGPDKRPDKRPKHSDEDMHKKMKNGFKESAGNLTECLAGMESIPAEDWELMNQWSEKKGQDETVRFLQLGCKKYGRKMKHVIGKIRRKYADLSLEKGPFKTVDENIIPQIDEKCDASESDNICDLKGRQLCSSDNIYCTGATGISSARTNALSAVPLLLLYLLTK